ncbi:IgGFc-binding protein-like [Xenopus laevis]|uniref:IgGFc-binding protein-like n=2 Tax=Xenopus laevis TaxID=8355 RepID=A0A310UE34_XENLA|nr:IgGFc-binding protein-like [Xenopus laevis]OCT56907.1 hypothetical protein XELAEV_18004212mg [Xenopus laevis]
MFSGLYFVTAFMEVPLVEYNKTRFDLLLHGLNCCAGVTVKVPGTNFSQFYSLSPGQIANVTIPTNVMLVGSSLLYNCIVEVSSNKSIIVISQVWTPNGFDSSYVFPTRYLDLNYYILTPVFDLPGYAQFAIVNQYSTTTVSVTIEGGVVEFSGQFWSPGSIITFTLGPYQAAQFQLRGNLYGTSVEANNRVAVLSGYQTSLKYCYVYEQLLPQSGWGKSFILPSPSVPQQEDKMQLIAAEITDVTVYNDDGKKKYTVQMGNILNLPVNSSSLQIVANRAVMVLYISPGRTISGDPTLQPYLATVIPIERFETLQVIHAPSTLSTHLLVIAKWDKYKAVKLDGSSFPAYVKWNKVSSGQDNYAWVEVALSAGSHFVCQVSEEKVWATAYSFSGPSIPVVGKNFSVFGPNSCSNTENQLGNSSSVLNPQSTTGSNINSSPSSHSNAWTPVGSTGLWNPRKLSVEGAQLGWWDALRYCRENGSDLISVPDLESQRLLETVPKDIAGMGIWIGLRRHRVWGTLYWTDKTPVDYTNWGEGQPSDPTFNLCTMLSVLGGLTWEAECCSTKLRFICN